MWVWGRWILALGMIARMLEDKQAVNTWEYPIYSILFFILFRSDIQRLLIKLRMYLSANKEKHQHHVYEDIEPQKFNDEDGLNRRIIRASDGEFLVAVEDPETGALYLEENR